ncbi:hypothetical protein [Rhizobium arsenicireducens]
MPAASRATYCLWVVDALTTLGPSTPKAVYDWIRKNEPVPAADLSGLTSDGENLFEKEVRFARWQLRLEGTVLSPKRGVWSLK